MKKFRSYLPAMVISLFSLFSLNAQAQDYSLTVAVSATGDATGSPVRDYNSRQDPLNTVGQTSPSVGKDLCPADPTPGCDFSASDLLIRTHDLIDYDFDYSLATGDDTNVTLTSTLPVNFMWQFLPSFCSGAGSALSNDSRTLTCNVGDKTAGTSQTLPFRARVLGQANGSTVAIQGTVTGDSGNSATSALTPTVTVTAAPRWDIRNSSSNNPGSTTFNGELGLKMDLLFYYGSRDVWAGVEPLQEPITFELDVRPNNVLRSCGLGTCTQPGGKGTPVLITFNGATDLNTYRTSSYGSGATEFTTNFTSISLFMSVDDIVANGGSAHIGGNYTDYNPLSISGQQNYLGQGELLGNNNNARIGYVLRGGGAKSFDDNIVAAGQDLNFSLSVHNSASLVPVTNAELCDVLDLRHFNLREVSPGSAVISSSATAVVEYANTYTAATPPADDNVYTNTHTLAECNDQTTVWHPTTTAAGGVSQIKKIRVRVVDEVAAASNFSINFAGTVLRTGAPSGTYIGNHFAIKVDEINSGNYQTYNYNILTGAGNNSFYRFGARTVIGNSLVSLTKKTDDPNTASFPDNTVSNLAPGDSLRFVLQPTITSDRDPLENASVQVVDVLPDGLTYVSAAPVPTSVQTDTPNPGETTITWDFTNVVPNVAMPTITLETLVSLAATNNQILTNTSVVSSPEDTITSLTNRTAERNVTISSPGQVNVQKTVGTATILPDESLPYTLSYYNGTSSTLNTIDMIDVLPYDTDSRGTTVESGSTLDLQDPTAGLSAGVTATYSSRAPADIIENPADASNQPGGATSWCSSADFNTAGCPTGFADVTAVRFLDATAYPAGDPAREISFSLNTAGNKPSNAYNNTFTLTAQGLSLPVGSSAAATTVVGVGIGGTVFKDVDNDGIFNTANSDDLYAGVIVELFESGKVPGVDAALSNATTDSAGTYFFDLLVPGDYFVHIPQSSIAALAGDNISSDGGSAATVASPDTDNDDDGVDDGVNSATGVQSAVITLTAGGEPTTDGVVASQTANNSMNLTLDFGFTRAPSDFGDAPDFYATLDGSGGAYHTITAGLQLGANIDAETNGFVDGVDDNGSASDDDSASGTGNGNDEDSVSGFLELKNTDTDYAIPAAAITVQNSTVASATLHAWIDFDGNGSFEATEHSSTTVGIGASNPASDLTWTGLSNIATQTTYVRLRLTSDAAITASTPGGYANSGEVEDYPLPVTVLLPLPPVSTSLGTCPAPASGTYGEDFQVGWFGNVTSGGKDPDGYWAQPNTSGAEVPGTGPDVDSASHFAVGPGIVHDHNGSDVEFTGVDQTSVEAALGDGDYIDYSFTTPANLADGRALNQFGHGDNTNTLYPFNVTILVSDSTTFTTAARIAEGETITGASPYSYTTVPNTNNQNILLLPNTTYYVRAIFYNNTSGAANDKIQWDDFQLGTGLCADYPDAPDTLGVATHAQPETPTVFLGAGLTTDVTSFNSATAVGDTDDGVTLPVLNLGGTATIVTTVAGSGGYLQGWIDWNGDGDFADTVDGISEQISIDAQDNITGAFGLTDDADTAAGQISIVVSVPPSATTNQTFARFRWSTANGLNSTTAASDGEVEDYALTIQNDFVGQSGTPSVCKAATLSTTDLLADDSGTYSNATSLIWSNAGGGGLTMTLQKTAGSDSVGGSSANLYPAPFTDPVRGVWLGSDDQYAAKNANAGLDEETYEIAFDQDFKQLSFTIAAHNYNIDGDERIEFVRVENAAGSNVTNSTLFNYTANTGDLVFNSTTGRIEGGTSYNAGGNDNGTIVIENTAGFSKVIFKRIEIDNASSSKTQPQRNRSNGVTLGPVSYCVLNPKDHSDAPADGTTSPNTAGTTSYGTATHVVTAGIQLGVDITDEASAVTDADNASDDGISTLPTLTAGDTADAIIAKANITASGTGTLHAWIDFDGDGAFAEGEYASTTVTSGTVDNDLTFSSYGTTMAAGTTYARFRLTSDGLLDVNEKTPDGAASDGEVEDYALTISPAIIATPIAPSSVCSAVSTPFTFPNGASGVMTNGAASINYSISQITNGYASVAYNGNVAGIEIDHLPDTASNPDSFEHTITLSNVPAGHQPIIRLKQNIFTTFGNNEASRYTISWTGGSTDAYYNDPITTSASVYQDGIHAGFDINNREIEGVANEGMITNGGSFNTYMVLNNTTEWHVEFPLGVTSVTIRKDTFDESATYNNRFSQYPAPTSGQPPGESSREWIGIEVVTCLSDYSDAPANGEVAPDGSSATAYGEASHTLKGGIQLGATITDDLSAVTDADNASDDGITLPTLMAGDTAAVTIPIGDITATSTDTVNLYGWIDFNGDGAFAATEFASTTVTNGTVDGPLTFSSYGTTMSAGTTHARFRLTSDTLTSGGAASAANDGEVEDYALTVQASTSNIPISRCDNPTDANPNSGTGALQDQLYLFNWDGADFADGLDAGDTQTFNLPSGVQIVATVTSVSGAGAATYATTDMATWSQAAFSLAYNSSGTQEAFYGGDAAVIDVTMSFVGTKNGVPFPLDLLAIDSESTGDEPSTPNDEQITFTTNGEDWTFVETIHTQGGTNGTYTLSGQTLIADETYLTGSSLYVSNNASEIRVQIAFLSSPPAGQQGFAYGTFLRCDITAEDYGDAPSDLSAIDASMNPAYPTLIADNAASHTIDNVTFLGSGVSAEADGQPTTAANGDDDDGVTFPTLSSTNVLLVGQANNINVTASVAGFLNAWIDINQDGDWDDSGEQIATNQALAAGSNTVTFTPATTQPNGDTYLRFRFTSASVTTPSPGGALPDGEVEDYQVAIVLPEPGACSSGLIDGGFENYSVANTANRLQGDTGNYGIYRENVIPGWSFIANDPAASSNGVSSFDVRNAVELWKSGFGGVPAYAGNQFAEINAYVAGTLFQDLQTSPGTVVSYQFAHRGRDGSDTIDVLLGAPGATTSQTGGIGYMTDTTGWKVYSGTYTVPAGQTITRFSFRAINTASSSDGGGNFLDDVQFGFMCNDDYSDTPADGNLAPDGTSTTAYGEAKHTINNSIRLGSSNDQETSAPTSADAYGDGAEDDGLRLNGTTLQNQVINGGSPITLTATTLGTGRLYGWIDWDGNGVFGNNANELIISETSDGTGTRTFTVTPPNGLTPGNSFARFRYSTDTAAANPSGSASDGEVEDYRITLTRSFNVSGRVFNDTNVDGSSATTEPGISDLPVVLYDTVNTTCISTRTDANGDYSFTDVAPGDYQVYEASREAVPVPQSCGVANARDPSGYLSTTANNTAVFTVSNTDLSGINFGDVRPPVFELDNTQNILPNSVALHPHVFTARSDGSVSFSIASENTDPSSLNWGLQLLLDANCNGQLDSADSALPTSINVTAGQQVCLLSKVISPADTPTGAVHVLDVQSEFTFGSGGVLSNNIQVHQDITRSAAGTTTAPPDDPTVEPVGDPDPISGEGQLSLVKEVWNATQGSTVGDNDGSVALPGETLRYTITYTNIGNGPLNELIINDSVPAFTQLVDNSMLCTDKPAELLPCAANDSADGSLSWSWTADDKLLPGSGGSVSYEITIE